MKLSEGTAHKIPNDLRKALVAEGVPLLWEDITPLARNEFICWIVSAKQEKTRKRRIERTVDELLDGARRPCCWAGCIHRKDKPLSNTQKWVFKV